MAMPATTNCSLDDIDLAALKVKLCTIFLNHNSYHIAMNLIKNVDGGMFVIKLKRQLNFCMLGVVGYFFLPKRKINVHHHSPLSLFLPEHLNFFLYIFELLCVYI